MSKLREERIKHGYTLKQIGSMIGVSEASVSLYETGKREPSNDTLKFLADLYGVTVDYLLGREESPKEVTCGPIKENPRPLMLDGDPVMGWADDRPETQAIARELYAMALNIGATKEDVDAFRNYMLLTKGEQNYIKTSMKALRSQHKEEEGT